MEYDNFITHKIDFFMGNPKSGKTIAAGSYPKPLLYVSVGNDGGGRVLMTKYRDDVEKGLIKVKNLKNDPIINGKIATTSPEKLAKLLAELRKPDADKFKKVLLEHFSEDRCIKAGVFVKGKFGTYPVFRTPCLLFPYYDIDGNIRNIQSRYLGENKDKKIARFNNCVGKSPIMFNLPILKETGMDANIYVAEGVTDCLAYLSEGKNAVALPGAGTYRDEYSPLLVDKMLFIYIDKDEAGQALFDKMNASLNKMGGCIHNIRKDEKYHDYSDLYLSKYYGKKDKE